MGSVAVDAAKQSHTSNIPCAATVPSDPVSEALRLEATYGTFLGHPKGLLVLFLSELWERFGFYGMRALLIFYMTQSFMYSDARAGSIYGIYTGSTYLSGILGGFLADKYLGQRRAITYGGILMAIGYFAMTVHSTPVFFAAMSAIAFGTGFFKPNTTALVGALYEPGDDRRDRAYGLYYMGINIGSLAAILLCGLLGQKYGWHWGFGAAGVGMVLGVTSFVIGRRYLGNLGEVAQTTQLQGLAVASLTHIEKRRIAAIILLGIFGNIAFFATFEQAGSSLSLFAERSTRLAMPGTSWEMPASWIQVANPVFIILLTPIFGALWKAMASRKRDMTTPAKMATGLLMLAVGFSTMVVAGHLSDTLGAVSLGWLIATYYLHTCGELFAAPAGLSMVSRLAPAAYTGRMMSVWFATIAVANLLGGLMAGEYASMTQAHFFLLPACTALVAGLLLFALKNPITRLMHERQR